ncbi:peptidylprolyl isomerase [Maribellus maritimus]|uniref:peptidylprolyl isomerase n=1 Tax=Maribellus maritimus TaxID=2870838 RepID=UPI001EECCA6E|nr:SurA N-terminal domain-containing protein [Maribellus maritimus]MCG6189020.1 SurA N-terminal domain-containing protein [Maribellus maritimus]
MATLQKIRTKAGLLVAIVIGVSLAAFILGDMLQSGNSLFRKNQLKIGEVDGESIQYPEFQQKVEELGEIYRMNSGQSQLDENTWVQIREQTWQNFIQEKVMGDVYDDLGIDVSSDELFDMLQGSNLHPIVQQLFANPNTGQVDRNAIVNFLKNLDTGVDPEQRQYWLYLEQQIVKDRIQTKYANMVGKGLYVTTEEAQNSLVARNKQFNIDYILLNNNSVADSQIVVTQKDIKNYYDAHKEDYKQETTRRIEYINFPVEPSATDFRNTEEWVKDIKTDFASATDNIQFVNSNSDISFDGTWFKKDELPVNIGNWIYEENADTNDVFGPYFESEAYKLAKLNAIEMLPDSVEARHILLRVNTQAEVAVIQNLADSLKTAIENGSDFATLARQFSTDQGSAIQGGDLGWFGRGQMVKPFEDAAFSNKVNEVTVVMSQFGFHVIQTTDRGKLSKQIQVAYLVRNVQPSTQTYQDAYAKASKFASENTNYKEFEAAVAEQNLTKKVATIGENDRLIAGLENPRQLIRAAYEAEEGDIIFSQEETPIFELGDNFVIAALTNITEEGIAPLDDVQARVELAVTKEKKAELLKEKAAAAMNGKTDLQAIAGELDATVENATSINFNSFQLPGVGLEPAVIGTAASLDTDQLSKPIVGNNGVFIVQVTSVNELENQDVAAEQTRLAQSLTFRANSQVVSAHESEIEIVDKRSKFY